MQTMDWMRGQLLLQKPVGLPKCFLPARPEESDKENENSTQLGQPAGSHVPWGLEFPVIFKSSIESIAVLLSDWSLLPAGRPGANQGSLDFPA